MKYESELINEILEKRGHKLPSLHYQSECVKSWIDETKGAYPKLCDYQSEWLNYILENTIGNFPYEIITTNSTATVNNVVPLAYKSANLKGSTKYRDIDTGDILDTFDETKNLELVTVKMPVLTTSNENGTKTNILSTSKDVELRGIGDVQDTLNCLTGEVTQRIGEIVFDGSENWQALKSGRYYLKNVLNNLKRPKNTDINFKCDKLNPITYTDEYNNAMGISIYEKGDYDFIVRTDIETIEEFKEWLLNNQTTVQYQLATESIKTVDLMITNQNGETLRKIKPIEGTMNIEVTGVSIPPIAILEIPVEAITQNLQSFIEEE